MWYGEACSLRLITFKSSIKKHIKRQTCIEQDYGKSCSLLRHWRLLKTQNDNNRQTAVINILNLHNLIMTWRFTASGLMQSCTLIGYATNNNNNLFIYSVLVNMLGDQKRITTINNLKTINTNIRNIQAHLISKRY